MMKAEGRCVRRDVNPNEDGVQPHPRSILQSLCIASLASQEFWNVLVAMPLPCSEVLGNPRP